MKITKYIAIACAILSLASCDDWLGNKPKGYTIPETYADYEKLISSQYLINVLDPYLVYFTDDPMMVEKAKRQLNGSNISVKKTMKGISSRSSQDRSTHPETVMLSGKMHMLTFSVIMPL